MFNAANLLEIDLNHVKTEPKVKREIAGSSPSPSPLKKRKTSNLSRSVSNNFTKATFEKLNDFRKKEFLCDFEIRANGKAIHVHRNILAASSEFFREYFSVNPNIKSIEMGNVSMLGVECCVEFMYTSKISVNLNKVEPILDVAPRFRLNEVTRLCLEHINEILGLENCLAIKAIAEKYKIKDLEEKAEKFAAENLHGLIKEDVFSVISKRNLVRLLNLNASSKTIFSALMVWLHHDTSRKNELHSVLSSIKMSQFSVAELINMTNNEQIMTSSKSLEVIGQEILRRFSRDEIPFDPDNWSALRDLFIKFKLFDLEVKVNRYVLENFTAISKTESFLRMDKGTLTFFLKAIPLSKISEKPVWGALVKWTKFDEERLKFFPEIVKNIDLSQFSYDFIKSTIRKEPFVVCDNDCLNLVIEAIFSQPERSKT